MPIIPVAAPFQGATHGTGSQGHVNQTKTPPSQLPAPFASTTAGALDANHPVLQMCHRSHLHLIWFMAKFEIASFRTISPTRISLALLVVVLYVYIDRFNGFQDVAWPDFLYRVDAVIASPSVGAF